MPKFFGTIGFAETVETTPGVWKDRITERKYYCEVERFNSRWSTQSDSTNDDLNVNSQFSMIADAFASSHFTSMKYIEFMGAKWKITSIEPKHPRLILTVGGLYNG